MPNRAALLTLLTLVAILLRPAVSLPAEPARPAAQPAAPQAPVRALLVYPPEIDLNGPRDSQQVIVLDEYADGRQRDLTREAAFSTDSPAVARLDAGVVYPAGDGTTSLTVRAGSRAARIPVRVQRASADAPVSFAREVIPALTRAPAMADSTAAAGSGSACWATIPRSITSRSYKTPRGAASSCPIQSGA
jgi:hypothetical protein